MNSRHESESFDDRPPQKGAAKSLHGLKADDPGQVVQDLFGWSQKLVGIDGAVFFLVDESALLARFGFEVPPALTRDVRLSLADDGPIQACVRRNVAQVVIAPAELLPGVPTPWATAVCIPLTIEGASIGVYLAGWHASFDVDRDIVLVLEGAASLAASSVHRARLLYDVKREEQRLRRLLDRLPIPAVGFSTPELAVTHVNAEARRLLADVRGQPLPQVLTDAGAASPDGPSVTEEEATKALLSPTRLARFQITALDGSTRIMFPHIATLGPSESVIMLVDVTQETSLERQRKRFVRMISHHLRTPLTPLMGFAEVLAVTESADLEVQQAASEISAAVSEITDQIHRLEQIAHLQPLDKGNLDASTISSVILSAWDNAGGIADDLRLEGDIDAQVVCSPDYVIRAMSEIFTNAYLHGRPPVSVTVFTKGDDAVISCQDSGDGIPAEWESAIFDPYLTARDGYEASPVGHLGLGLTMARALLEATLGRLTYQDGSFVVRLPLNRGAGSGV